MHFLIRETLSFNLIYVAACYLVGTGMCHNMVGLLQHYYHFIARTTHNAGTRSNAILNSVFIILM